ncbi:predicted GPI-anchored protein 58 [Miscanthus floridulus]|uniref:predicted GPI-anchored protein 58 n=1 Tax=Miscanthus floridulus TaxID=154761 RepID=UPI003458BA4A
MTKKVGPSQPYSIPVDRPRACCPQPPPPPSRSAAPAAPAPRRACRARASPRPPRPRLAGQPLPRLAALPPSPGDHAAPAPVAQRPREPRPRPAVLAPAADRRSSPDSAAPRPWPRPDDPGGARPALLPGPGAPASPAVPDEAGCPWSGRRAPPAAGQQ